MHNARILNILESKLIRWANEEDNAFIVAASTMNASQMPYGVQLSQRPIKGKRVIRKNQRVHANQRLHVADWPEANLHELTVPKLACVVSGQVDYSLGSYSVHCGEGTIIFIPPRTPHHRSGVFLNTPSPTSSYLIFHAYAYSRGTVCWLTGIKDGRPFSEISNHYLLFHAEASAILHLLINEAVSNQERRSTMCRNYLSAFFITITREIKAGNYMHPGPIENHRIQHSSHTHFDGFVREYLELNCYKPLKLADAASHFHMSPSQFMRRLRKEGSMTFNELLVEIRIERAKALLQNTEQTFNAIANHLSYRSPSYFLALFKQKVGVTPAEYRRQKN